MTKIFPVYVCFSYLFGTIFFVMQKGEEECYAGLEMKTGAHYIFIVIMWLSTDVYFF